LKWRLSLAIQNGEFAVPVGYDPEQMLWGWAPDGIPWWNPGDEVKANVAAIEAGLKSRSQTRLETDGDDWRDVIDDLAEEQAYMQEKGVRIISANEVKMAQVETQNQQQEQAGGQDQQSQ
jgi:capsid protein